MGRAGRAAAPGRRERCRGGCRAADPRDPVRPLRHHLCRVGHADAPAAGGRSSCTGRSRGSCGSRSSAPSPSRPRSSFLPRRVALALPLIVLVYWLVASKPIWYGPYPYGVKQAGAGAALPGHPRRRARLDRRAPCRPARTWPCSGRAARDRFTVNQNEFFNRSVGQVYYTVRPTRRRRRRDARRASTSGRAIVRLADGSAVPSRLPAHRRLRRARRDRRRPRSAARDDALEGERAAGPREDARHRDLPGRHVVGPARDLVAASTAVAAP